MKVNPWWKSLQQKSNLKIPSAGIYHFVNQTENNKNRVHLRVEQDGAGLLMINAARAYHLNPSATSMAFWSLSGNKESEIVHSLKKLFQVDHLNASSDTTNFLDSFNKIIDPAEQCPICELDLDIDLPFSHTPTAPYRMDLAITYRCNNDCTHCYNARNRKFPELSTDEWYRIIDKLWDLGIPHLVFTGGEPTLRSDLPNLITYAEKKGQITGINTNGRKLADRSFLKSLVDAGLDHIQITLESSDPEIHDQMVNRTGAWQQTISGIRNAVSEKIYFMTNTTMLATNVETIPQTLDLLAELMVPTVGLNALIYSGKGKNVGTGLEEKDLSNLLEIAKKKTNLNNQKLIWYTPTEYCNFNPISNDLGVKGCTAALYNMCIEPDGSVLPCQSYYQSLGNILSDSWVSIWDHSLSRQLRERNNLPIKCNGCDLVNECGGGCPLIHITEEAF
ncbi:MAG: radical SAM protein [Anaerolineaceae bacterium]